MEEHLYDLISLCHLFYLLLFYLYDAGRSTKTAQRLQNTEPDIRRALVCLESWYSVLY